MTDHPPPTIQARLQALAAAIERDPQALLLGLAIAIHTEPDSWARVTQAELADLLGMSRRTIQRKLAALKKGGLIDAPTARRGRLKLSDRLTDKAPESRHKAPPRRLNTPDEHKAPHRRLIAPESHLSPPPDPPNKAPHRRLINQPTTTQKIRSKDKRYLGPSDSDDARAGDHEGEAKPPPLALISPPSPDQPKPSRKRPPTLLPEDWQPAQETTAALINLGFDPAAIEAEVGPFKIYWRERRERRAAWQAGFINWMKNQRKWEQRDAQRTEQQARFTDASGRPISEREATRQARIERLLEPFDGEIDLDMRI